MTIGELRVALAHMPAEATILVSYTDGRECQDRLVEIEEIALHEDLDEWPKVVFKL